MSIKARILALVLGASLVSIIGVNHVKQGEGLRFTAYPDPASGGTPWTICYGHTKGVYRGMTATQAQCDRWLREDLAVAEEAVQRLVRVPLTQGQYDAFVSFVFNVGESRFASSTMLKLLNQGQHTAACNQLPKWVYASGKKLNGLITRRDKEKAICLRSGSYVYFPKN